MTSRPSYLAVARVPLYNTTFGGNVSSGTAVIRYRRCNNDYYYYCCYIVVTEMKTIRLVVCVRARTNFDVVKVSVVYVWNRRKKKRRVEPAPWLVATASDLPRSRGFFVRKPSASRKAETGERKKRERLCRVTDAYLNCGRGRPLWIFRTLSIESNRWFADLCPLFFFLHFIGFLRGV